MADYMYGGEGSDFPTGFLPDYTTQNAAPPGYTSGSDLPSGDTSGGGGAIPSWLSKFFATQGVPGALISGAGGLLAANMTGNAARDAAARSGQASEAATALQARQYADAQARSQPYYTAGTNALEVPGPVHASVRPAPPPASKNSTRSSCRPAASARVPVTVAMPCSPSLLAMSSPPM